MSSYTETFTGFFYLVLKKKKDMSTPKLLGIVLLALKITGAEVNLWIIVFLILFGYVYELCRDLLKAGGWLDQYKNSLAREYIKQQQRIITKREIKDLNKKRSYEQGQ